MMLEIYLPLKSCIISVHRHLELNLLVMTINCQYTQWYNTTSEVLSSEVIHNRTHSVIKSTMVLPLPLKYCQLPVNLQLLHYIDNGHFLTPYLLSAVSAYIVILLYMLSMVNFSSSTMVLILPLKYCQLT